MYTKISGNTLIIRGEKGEEITEVIKKACEKHNVISGVVSAIGATDDATVGVFSPKTKKYDKINYKGDYEILNITGNISTMDGQCYPHLHISILGEDNKTVGGHLDRANISLTLEAFITILDAKIERIHSEKLGISLMEF